MNPDLAGGELPGRESRGKESLDEDESSSFFSKFGLPMSIGVVDERVGEALLNAGLDPSLGRTMCGLEGCETGGNGRFGDSPGTVVRVDL